MRRALAFGLLGLALLALPASADDLDLQIRQQQDLLRRIESQLEYQGRLVKSYSEQEKGILGELERINKAIVRKDEEIKLLDLQIRRTERNVESLRSRIRGLEGEIESLKEVLARRVAAMYKYGEVGKWEVLLSASSASQLMERTYYLRRLAEEDRRVHDELLAKIRELEAAKRELQAQQAELEAKRRRASAERASLAKEQERRDKLLSDIRSKREFYQRAMEEHRKTLKEVEEGIRRLLEEKARRERDRDKPSSGLLAPRKGQMLWPVEGEITSTFGERPHPVFNTRSMHTGIDIVAPYGTAVRAAASGEVLYAGWVSGYGQVVILDHGGGITTVYAHLSRMLVSEGQSVRAGDVIGRVGRTGLATTAHLHFEVRVDGKAVDPMPYLSSR